MFNELSIAPRMLRSWLLLSIALGWSVGLAPPGAAQTAVIGGTVTRDSSGSGLGGVAVSIMPGNRTARTNYLGEFRVKQLPGGRYAVAFRRVGFLPRVDTVVVTDGQVVDAEFMLRETPVELQAAKTLASPDAAPFFLREFDDRRKTGFGQFMTDSMLRRDADNHALASFLSSRIPGLHVISPRPGVDYLSSGRAACEGAVFQCAHPGQCVISVYINGHADYVSATPGMEPTNFQSLRAEDFAALEYYPSGATAPMQYNQTGSSCGVLLLWRRIR